MFNTLVVVWRESLEAMLVVGVLAGWIARQADPAALRRGLWVGVGAGLVLALALGGATLLAQSQLEGQALEVFQLGMMLFAALLITQMVFWMHRHGRAMRYELEAQASRRASAFGMAAIAAIAVAREGAETALFLYGLGLEASGAALAGMAVAAGAGFALAAATGWIIARSARWLSYRSLFAASEIALLLIGGALVGSVIDRMMGLDWLPPLVDPLWDTSAVVDDTRGLGRLLADFAGYRARPSALYALVLAAYWGHAWWRRRAPRELPGVQPAAAP